MKNYKLKDELDNIARRNIPEDINLWPNISVQLERKSQMFKPRSRPIVVIMATLLSLLVLSGVTFALGNALGYLPGVGLVENNSGIRILASPSSVTREGITVTVSQALVYQDHVELSYTVDGIAELYDSGKDMCSSNHSNNDFWSDADAELRLPDGTVVRRDYEGKYQSQNINVMKPVYAVSVPSNVTEITMLLQCIPFTKLGTAPENWEIPFQLVAIPAGTVVGEPVVDVYATSKPIIPESASSIDDVIDPVNATGSVPSPVVTMTLTRIIPVDPDKMVVYLSLNMEEKDPSLVSIMPLDVYMIDSQGQKTRMRGNYLWQPFEHRVGSEFEFTTQAKPAAGPLTIVVEKAVAYYAPGHVDPSLVKPSDLEFTFEVGENPQFGQTWALNNTIEIAGYPIRVTSARAINWDEVKTPSYIDGSQGYEYGYMFTVETDPSIKFSTEMDIMFESPLCRETNGNSLIPTGSTQHYAQLCRNAYPNGQVKVQIWQLAVLVENTWQATWQP